MDPNAELLKDKLTELFDLINQILPSGDEDMAAPPQSWIALNELSHEISEMTERQSDYWREVARRR